MDPRLERDQVGAALDQQILAEAVAPVHLERQAAEVAEPVLAHAHERAALATELARGGRDAAAARRLGRRRRRDVLRERRPGVGRGRLDLDVVVGTPAEAGQQRHRGPL